jgi:hypothetical protein
MALIPIPLLVGLGIVLLVMFGPTFRSPFGK